MSDLIHTGTTSAMVEGARAEGVMEAVARAVGVMAVAARACYFGDTYSIHDKRRILPNLSSSCDAHPVPHNPSIFTVSKHPHAHPLDIS